MLHYFHSPLMYKMKAVFCLLLPLSVAFPVVFPHGTDVAVSRWSYHCFLTWAVSDWETGRVHSCMLGFSRISVIQQQSFVSHTLLKLCNRSLPCRKWTRTVTLYNASSFSYRDSTPIPPTITVHNLINTFLHISVVHTHTFTYFLSTHLNLMEGAGSYRRMQTWGW